MAEKYDKVRKARLYKADSNCCGVVAVSIACRLPYNKAHEVCARVGRKNGQGMSLGALVAAIQVAGCQAQYIHPSELKQANGSRYTCATIGKALKRGYYIAYTRNHAVAVVNGKVEDWTEGHRHQIRGAWKVTVPKGSRS